MPIDPLEWYLASSEYSINSSNCNCHQYYRQHLQQYQLLLPERTFLTTSRQNGLASPKSILKTPARGTGQCSMVMLRFFYQSWILARWTVQSIACAQGKVASLFPIPAKYRQVPKAMGYSPKVCLNLLPVLISLWPGSLSSVSSAKLWQQSWWQPSEQWQDSI